MWTLYADALEEFLIRVEQRKANTEEERVAILFELLEEGKIERLVKTSRSKEQITEDLKKNFNVETAEDLLDKE